MHHDRRQILTQCADKYAVRTYVEERVGRHVLTTLYGVWADPADIPFEQLPEKFVLKTTHGSGQILFFNKTPRCSVEETRAQLTAWLARGEYWCMREWAYKEIPPRIICEEFLSDAQGRSPPDYKFFCFHGEPRLIQVDTDRFTAHRRDFYDTDWFPMAFNLIYPGCGHVQPRPVVLDTMLDIARALSQGHPFMRVDLYALGERVVFGEITWYPEGGVGRFTPESWDWQIGTWLTLPTRAFCRRQP
jgi:hypothetical protein